MKISPEKLAAEAEATGFRPDVLEKVAHLLGLLDAIRSHPFLKGKLVLLGSTAGSRGGRPDDLDRRRIPPTTH